MDGEKFTKYRPTRIKISAYRVKGYIGLYIYLFIFILCIYIYITELNEAIQLQDYKSYTVILRLSVQVTGRGFEEI